MPFRLALFKYSNYMQHPSVYLRVSLKVFSPKSAVKNISMAICLLLAQTAAFPSIEMG